MTVKWLGLVDEEIAVDKKKRVTRRSEVDILNLEKLWWKSCSGEEFFIHKGTVNLKRLKR